MIFALIVMLVMAKLMYNKGYTFEKMFPYLLLVGLIAFFVPVGSILANVFGGLIGGMGGAFGGIIGGFFGLIGGLIGAVFGLVFGLIGLIGFGLMILIPLGIVYIIAKLVS